MIFTTGLDRDGYVDVLHAHRLAEDTELATAEPVLTIEGIEIGAVCLAGNIGLVGVPVEQVERARLLAEHVVVDDIAPDEIDRAKPVERFAHEFAGHDAIIGLDDLADSFPGCLVGKHHEVARIAEIRL